MSVEASESLSESWAKWQGYVVNGTFPLHRYLGSSVRSGVFLIEFPERDPPQVAIKLVPANTALAESQLAQWDAAAGLAHPHLIRIFETGRCQLGVPCLYVAMEYGEQSLAELLRHRSLTEAEALETLLPTLSVLGFLHNKNLVHGQLKPTNVLAVGEQLKLAGDTVRRVGEGTAGFGHVSVYDPPEAREGNCSTASDVWALGVTLYEALTRSLPPGLDDRRGGVVLPADFSSPFRDMIASCLSRRPYDRPKLAEIEAWVRRRSAELDPAAAAASGSAQVLPSPAAAAVPTAAPTQVPPVKELPGAVIRPTVAPPPAATAQIAATPSAVSQATRTRAAASRPAASRPAAVPAPAAQAAATGAAASQATAAKAPAPRPNPTQVPPGAQTTATIAAASQAAGGQPAVARAAAVQAPTAPAAASGSAASQRVAAQTAAPKPAAAQMGSAQATAVKSPAQATAPRPAAAQVAVTPAAAKPVVVDVTATDPGAAKQLAAAAKVAAAQAAAAQAAAAKIAAVEAAAREIAASRTLVSPPPPEFVESEVGDEEEAEQDDTLALGIPPRRRFPLLGVSLGAVAILLLAWASLVVFTTHPKPTSALPAQAAEDAPPQAPTEEPNPAMSAAIEPVSGESTQPEVASGEAARAEPARVGPAPGEAARVEPTRVGAAHGEAARAQAARVGAVPGEAARVEPTRVGVAHGEAARAQATRVGAAPGEAARAEPTRVSAAPGEAARAQPARVAPVAAQPAPTPVMESSAKAVAVSSNTRQAPAQTVEQSSDIQPSGIHKEIPAIPDSILKTIRGHVRVSVRLIVDKEGSVFAALVDAPGTTSRYFERVALEAAKKWTFPAAGTDERRLTVVHFDFSQQGATGENGAIQ